jgi:hypothetical protein
MPQFIPTLDCQSDPKHGASDFGRLSAVLGLRPAAAKPAALQKLAAVEAVSSTSATGGENARWIGNLRLTFGKEQDMNRIKE